MPPKNNKRKRGGAVSSSNDQVARSVPFNRFTIVPASTTIGLRYSDIFTFATGAAGIYGTQQSMRLNSIFDPDLTGTGHQPYGHDTLATLYGNYRVMAVDFDLMFTTPGSAADILCTASYGVSTTADLTGISPAVPLEWPNAVSGPLSSTGTRNRTLRGRIQVHTLLGVSLTTYMGDSNNTAAMGASPASLPRLNFATASYSGTGSQASSCRVVLVYHTYFFNRLNLAVS